jgi:RNA recognition motif-containing protein
MGPVFAGFDGTCVESTGRLEAFVMGTRLYVGNIPYSATDAELRSLFGQNGRQVTDVRIVTDRDTGQPRGFAFVELATDEQAQQAVAELNGAMMNGRPMVVNEARERERGPGGPPRGGFGGGGGGGGGPRPGGFGGGGGGGGPRPGGFGGGGGGGGGPRPGGFGGGGGPRPGGFGGGGGRGEGFGGGGRGRPGPMPEKDGGRRRNHDRDRDRERARDEDDDY